MQPKNNTERKKRILSFAGLYAGSIVLLFFIFSAAGLRFPGNEQQVNKVYKDAAPVGGNELLQADSVLHTGLYKLLQLDDQLALMPDDTMAGILRNTTLQSISHAEQSLEKAIDSIDQLSVVYTGAGKAVLYTTVINSFRAVLAERRALKNIRSSIASGSTLLSKGQQDIMVWSNELIEKENEIARLKATIKSFQGMSFAVQNNAGSAEAGKGEIELLKTAFADQQKEFELLKERYNRLKLDNNALATQVVEAKKTIPSRLDNSNMVTENKIKTLELQVESLNADLNFARIDCNLERADAQQIISNARQRKELLSASLNMLKELSMDGNVAVQKKAKEKIVRLTRIANTLHD